MAPKGAFVICYGWAGLIHPTHSPFLREVIHRLSTGNCAKKSPVRRGSVPHSLPSQFEVSRVVRILPSATPPHSECFSNLTDNSPESMRDLIAMPTANINVERSTGKVSGIKCAAATKPDKLSLLSSRTSGTGNDDWDPDVSEDRKKVHSSHAQFRCERAEMARCGIESHLGL